MEIEKNGKIYLVKENKYSWTLTLKMGRVSSSYNVLKEDCKNFEEVRKLVIESTMF